jgi:hypothetical protein
MDDATRQHVRRRAGERCEYCHLPQTGHEERFSIDHVRARVHDGPDTKDNLALCCLRCNLHKGTNLSGIEPLSGAVTTLFDPRAQRWEEHFEMNGPIIAGKTACGRATIAVLKMNAPERVRLRQSLIAEGLLGAP